VCVGASFQEFRRLSTGEFVRAVAKDLGQILLCDHRIVLALFGRSLHLIGRHIETLIPERFRDRHAGYRKGFLSEPSSRAMGAVENSSAEQPAAHEFGSWHRVPMRFFRWECSITSPTNRLAKY